MSNSAFSNILRCELKKQNIAKNKLAKMTGLSSRSISYYVKGERIPSINCADIILKALGVRMVIGLELID